MCWPQRQGPSNHLQRERIEIESVEGIKPIKCETEKISE